MQYIPALTLLLTPAYVIKVNVFDFPANVLMVWIGIVWAVFAAWLTFKRQWAVFFVSARSIEKKYLALIVLFFLAGTVSLFANGMTQAKLGQFIVLFLQPISLFFISKYAANKLPRTLNAVLGSCYLALALAGAYAVIQYLTLAGLPPSWWGNSVEPKRATSFFVHPNFYALFAAPLLAFLIPDLAKRIQNWKLEIGNWKFVIAWLLGAFGLFLSMSRAGWLGLAAAIGIYLIVAADKKIRKLALGAAIIGAAIVIATPNLRYRFLLPFYGEKSAVSRLSLWHTGWKGVKESPVTGLGLTGFSKQWKTLNTDPGLTADSHNFPHNIFLDLWVETGIIGLVSLTGLAGFAAFQGLKNRQNLIALGVSLFLIALVIQGQIDNPYFKNDLAMVFWIILSLAV